MKPEHLLNKEKPPIWLNQKKGFIQITVDLLESEPISPTVFDAITDALKNEGKSVISIGQKRVLTCRCCLNQTEGSL